MVVDAAERDGQGDGLVAVEVLVVSSGRTKRLTKRVDPVVRDTPIRIAIVSIRSPGIAISSAAGSSVA
jgi:hypothetical protein